MTKYLIKNKISLKTSCNYSFLSHLPSRVLRKRVGGNSKEADFMAHPKVFVTLSKHEKLMVIIAIKQKYNCFAQPKTF